MKQDAEKKKQRTVKERRASGGEERQTETEVRRSVKRPRKHSVL